MLSTVKSKDSKQCNKSPDLFCFCCATFIKSTSLSLTDKNREIYKKCYQVSVENNGADKPYSSSKLCSACHSSMRRYLDGKGSLRCTSPAVWESVHKNFQRHEDYCFVCQSTNSLDQRNKLVWTYPMHSNVKAAILNEFDDSPASKMPRMEIDPTSGPSDRYSDSENETDYEEEDNRPISSFQQPEQFDPKELNDLVRKMDLSKEMAMVLTSALKWKNLCKPEVRICSFKHRTVEIDGLFDEHHGIPFLKDVKGLFDWFGYEYDPNEWRLFIDSSLSALKCVLLHNGNTLPSIPLLYSNTLKENYADCKLALQLINYGQHNWKVIADLKLLNLLCGVGVCSTKNPCILCDWHGTNRGAKSHLNYHQNVTTRSHIQLGQVGVVNEPLINLEDVLLPPLHVKIGLIAQFLKSLDTEGPAFEFLRNLFGHKSEAKLKNGILNGPEIRRLLKNSSEFCKLLSANHKKAFQSFKSCCENFLGKYRSEDYEKICKDLVKNYEKAGCKMSYKLHILDQHLNFFPDDCSNYSDEMGERFHQEIKTMEKRYQGRFDKRMLADYCWFLKSESVSKSRKSSKKPRFPPKF